MFGEEERSLEGVEIGTRILVCPGEKVALDVIIERGNTSINRAYMTG